MCLTRLTAEQLAKAKDAKAITLLGVARVAGNVALIEAMATSIGSNIAITFGDITSKLDKKSNDMIDDTNGTIPVGATRNSADTITYGGTVILNDGSGDLITSATAITVSNGDLELVLESKVIGGVKSTEGKGSVSYFV